MRWRSLAAVAASLLLAGCAAAPLAASPLGPLDPPLAAFQECIATYDDGKQALCRDPRTDAKFVTVDGYEDVPDSWACLKMTSNGPVDRLVTWGAWRGRLPTDGLPDPSAPEVLGVSFDLRGVSEPLMGFARSVADPEAPYTTFTLLSGHGFFPMPGALAHQRVQVEAILVAAPTVEATGVAFDDLLLSWGEHDAADNWTRSYPTLVADIGGATHYLPAAETPWDTPPPPPGLLGMDASGWHDDTVVTTRLAGEGYSLNVTWAVPARPFAILHDADTRDCECPGVVMADDPAATAECAVKRPA